ncbi:MAG: hypothetical protein ACXADW_23775 [Candidatus Hodarchaeales archaeon]|jgi:hypothetical protein
MTQLQRDHELKRFSNMTSDQLKTRLYKITKRKKLEAFIEVARSFGYYKLATLAEEKLEFLYA